MLNVQYAEQIIKQVDAQILLLLPSEMPQSYQIIWWFWGKVLSLHTILNEIRAYYPRFSMKIERRTF